MVASCCLVSSCRINHLGANPVNGGRPPRESSISGVRAVRTGVFAQEVARVLMFVELLSLKTRNVENVIIKYVRRVSRAREGMNWVTSIIHPRWAMDEYAKIFRSWVWFSPPHPPTKVDVSPRKIKKSALFGCICRMRANGASFCHVDKISPVVRSSPCKTSGSQAWTGARPILRARAIVRIVAGRGWASC